MNKTVKAIIMLFLAYAILLVISYSTFLQIPVFVGEPLMWQSIVEQLTTWISPVVGVIYLFKVVLENKTKSKPVINEKKFIIPGVILLFVSAFSAGIHAVAQIVEDLLVYEKATNLYNLVFFFDEYIGHLFAVTLTIVLMMAVFMELNRKEQKLTRLDNILLFIFGIVNGLMWGLMGVEGGSVYLLIIPTMLITFIFLKKTIRQHKLKLNKYPFAKYSIIATLAMFVFVIAWVLSKGLFVQPSDLNYELMRF